MKFSLRPYGPNGWLVLHPDHSVLIALGEMLDSKSLPHFQEYTLGYESLLIQSKKPIRRELLEEYLRSISLDTAPENETRHHDIPVAYDGPDLEDTAKALKLSCDELVSMHSSAIYQVRFLGFSPGFPYLDGLPEQLHLPRRSSPRTRMQAGAVAIGGPHASIYTIPSPGGWHWLGNTEYPIFDRSQSDSSAFALKPGDTLTFVPQNA